MKDLVKKEYEVVVVGGGMAGVCAAIASARHGAKTALVHDRPVLGGNASSEIRMHICGADCHASRPDARETGIIEEILLENRRRNPQHSFSIFDTVIWEKVRFQEGLDLYLNAAMTGVTMGNGQIEKIMVHQLTTEIAYELTSNIFIDATGDGYLAHLAGADYKVGRESSAEFGESLAPEIGDRKTMGNTLMFRAVDTGKPVRFQKPVWAYSFTEEDLAYRGHSASLAPMAHYGVDSGYWWIELGGEQDTIRDGEAIRDELLKTVYGVWDHIKNSGDHGAENYALDWVGFLPGKRESRRIMGDYILKQQDLLEGRVFADAVAYGGWPMDVHPPEGFKHRGEPTDFNHLKTVYTIPYRSYYSRSISNLMMAGRDISATHLAFSSIRVMATCAVGGQAVGTAAAMTVQYHCLPVEIGKYLPELQQRLLKDDCYIPGLQNCDPADKALGGTVTVSSFIEGCPGSSVINGVSRTVGDSANCWVSDGATAAGQWLELQFKQGQPIGEVYLKFDSNLSQEIMTSLSKVTLSRQNPGLPSRLIKDYELQILDGTEIKFRLAVHDNYMRFRKHRINPQVSGDRIRVIVGSTYGDSAARIYEVRVY
ncbi:MAG TPA: FAD-dependent oxidoreductase [Bacillota bacterium]